ncbi:MAG: hypothetical protein F6K47_03935 [Symploca sp. SIO2E6]|nr:hypothetical protein [Symploca sp. SIO2E6]
MQQQVEKNIKLDKELVIHPDFFTAIKEHLPQITQVKIQLKRGYAHHEMNKFRYDVIFQVGGEVAGADGEELDWQQNQLKVSDICDRLLQTQPDCLVVKNVPNVRLFEDIKLLELLYSNSELKTVKELRDRLKKTTPVGIEPEEWWSLSESLPYIIEINGSVDFLDRYDVVFRHQDQTHTSEALAQPTQIQSIKPWSAYANNPLFGQVAVNLVPQLRNYLSDKLPDYMVPSAFIILECLPLTPNGKVDRRALPLPESGRSQLETVYVKPQNETETMIAKTWQEILQIDKVGIHDNFFELGGHSLLMAQTSRTLSEVLGQKISVVNLLQYSTVHSLAEALAQSSGEGQLSRGQSKFKKSQKLASKRRDRQGEKAQQRQRRKRHN